MDAVFTWGDRSELCLDVGGRHIRFVLPSIYAVFTSGWLGGGWGAEWRCNVGD